MWALQMSVCLSPAEQSCRDSTEAPTTSAKIMFADVRQARAATPIKENIITPHRLPPPTSPAAVERALLGAPAQIGPSLSPSPALRVWGRGPAAFSGESG